MNARIRRQSMSSEAGWVCIDDAATWDAAVEAVGADVFHRAWFHELAMARGEGTPRLFVFRSATALVVLPLLLRPIAGSDDFDATSVRGYVGPVSTGSGTQADVAAFQDALRAALACERVVSVCSSLHPLHDESSWLGGLGEVTDAGTTVSIALDGSPSQRRAAYTQNRRHEIARLRRAGYAMQGGEDPVNVFHRLYTAAMCRIGAQSRYVFGGDQLHAMVERGGMRLFVVHKENEVAAAGLFTKGEFGSHAFLHGTAAEHRAMAPSTWMIDEACEWAREWGARWMHLGRGVGGAEDARLQCTAGFGPRCHPLRKWRWIPDPHAYRAHCARSGVAGDVAFFPAYRT